MMSIYSVLYTLVLFSELSSHLVTVAMPANKVGDGIIEQDGRGLLLEDEPMLEPVVVPPVYRRNFVLDNNDMRLKGHSIRGLNPAFTRSLPLLTDRSLSHVPAEQSLKIDRRNSDLDMLRCMIGRVYRPCWEI
ncbi:pro-MCH isoform X2 [Larimichthys crocea]|uniref:pro-MCH isoform X2 n=1 Tax=Larimichthys crocea TaxID=215358 RepID=UPI0009013AB0|nr:pro-MCH isoform X2 [Larimichthys crocea]